MVGSIGPCASGNGPLNNVVQSRCSHHKPVQSEQVYGGVENLGRNPIRRGGASSFLSRRAKVQGKVEEAGIMLPLTEGE